MFRLICSYQEPLSCTDNESDATQNIADIFFILYRTDCQHDWRIYTKDICPPRIPASYMLFGVTSGREAEEKLFHQPQLLRDILFDIKGWKM